MLSLSEAPMGHIVFLITYLSEHTADKERGRANTMVSILSGLIPLFVFLGNVLILYGLFCWHGSRRINVRSPLTRNLLRSPGQFLIKQTEDLTLDLECHTVMMAVMPLLLYSSYLSLRYFGAAAEARHTWVIYALLGVASTVYYGHKICGLLTQRQAYRLGLDCEMAVGQELNNLMSEGYRVYHDVPGQGFNIDHVLVGHNGVFAVETKGRSKPVTGSVTVVYDGRTLRFPDRITTDYLDQARRQAKWLSRQLCEITGEAVPVQPVLVVPGWYVERARRGDVLVLNGRGDCNFIVNQWSSARLSRDLIQKISNILEQACRDVAPITCRQEAPKQQRPSEVLARIGPMGRLDKASGH